MSYSVSTETEFGEFVRTNFKIECVDCKSILDDIKKLKPNLRVFFEVERIGEINDEDKIKNMLIY